MNKPTRAHSSRSLSAVEVKSKFGAEFRRFSLDRSKPGRFGDFVGLLQHVHRVPGVELLVGYADVHGDLLPITNDDNFLLAIATATPMLRLFLQRKEDSDFSAFGSDPLTRRKSPGFSAVLLRPEARRKPPVMISLPRDFRPVSSIIDVDVLPESLRRVRLFKHGLHKPLGFYIRDGSSVRVTPQGLQKVPGIFISRMVPGGLAESTGLLAVNDEVLEVNGIEVTGKSLDQVTDMMIANSHNLIITVKPANQRNNVVRHREAGAASGSSGRSSDSGASFYGYGGYGASAVNSGPAHIIQNFPAGEMESDEEEDLVLEPGEEPSIPRYEPHLLLRRDPALSDPALSDPALSDPTLSDPALSDPTLSDPAGPAFSNGTLTASASLGSLTTASGSSPRRARERRSLEEDGTVITL